jgi:hypothetical protein
MIRSLYTKTRIGRKVPGKRVLYRLGRLLRARRRRGLLVQGFAISLIFFLIRHLLGVSLCGAREVNGT